MKPVVRLLLSALFLLLLSACGLSQGKVSVKVEPLPAPESTSASPSSELPGAADSISPAASGSSPSPSSSAAGSSFEAADAVHGTMERDYILNTGSRKFHLPECKSVADISQKNRAEFHGTREALLADDYSPCKRCNP